MQWGSKTGSKYFKNIIVSIVDQRINFVGHMQPMNGPHV